MRFLNLRATSWDAGNYSGPSRKDFSNLDAMGLEINIFAFVILLRTSFANKIDREFIAFPSKCIYFSLIFMKQKTALQFHLNWCIYYFFRSCSLLSKIFNVLMFCLILHLLFWKSQKVPINTFLDECKACNCKPVPAMENGRQQRLHYIPVSSDELKWFRDWLTRHTKVKW